MEDIVYLKDFLKKQIIVLNKDIDEEAFKKEYKLNGFNLIHENAKISAGDYIFVKKANFQVHIVKPNETLNSIAKKYNVTEKQIIEKNKILKIFIGKQLII